MITASSRGAHVEASGRRQPPPAPVSARRRSRRSRPAPPPPQGRPLLRPQQRQHSPIHAFASGSPRCRPLACWVSALRAGRAFACWVSALSCWWCLIMQCSSRHSTASYHSCPTLPMLNWRAEEELYVHPWQGLFLCCTDSLYRARSQHLLPSPTRVQRRSCDKSWEMFFLLCNSS